MISALFSREGKLALTAVALVALLVILFSVGNARSRAEAQLSVVHDSLVTARAQIARADSLLEESETQRKAVQDEVQKLLQRPAVPRPAKRTLTPITPLSPVTPELFASIVAERDSLAVDNALLTRRVIEDSVAFVQIGIKLQEHFRTDSITEAQVKLRLAIADRALDNAQTRSKPSRVRRFFGGVKDRAIDAGIFVAGVITGKHL